MDRRWWTRPRILAISLLLLAAGYIYAQPTLERWLSVELPSLVDETQRDDPGDEQGASSRSTSGVIESDSEWQLEKIGPDTWRSPAGLIWGPGPGQHRIDHVMLHTRDDPAETVHGVFDATSRNDVLKLLDEAYSMVSENPDWVFTEQDGERTGLTITLPRQIGYVGGEKGQRQNHPRTARLKLILEGNRVITAYPM